jgi:hypothetical protein
VNSVSVAVKKVQLWLFQDKTIGFRAFIYPNPSLEVNHRQLKVVA